MRHPATRPRHARHLVASVFAGAFAIAPPSTLAAQHEPARLPPKHGTHAPRLGAVSFPNSAKPAAQEPFLRGLALLHSYEYQDARAAFREATRVDAGFALA